METVLSILGFSALFVIYGIPINFIAMGIASGCDKWDSEDKAQYELFNPGVKPVWQVLRKQAYAASVLEEEQRRSLPLQTTGLAVTVGKNAGHDLDETTSVNSVMLKKVHYCLENQSVNENHA